MTLRSASRIATANGMDGPVRRCARMLPATMAMLACLATAAAAQTSAPGDDPVARGRYLADAADCMPCHTAPGGKPYAGGRAIRTPFGTVVSPNITPDRATGLGGWTADEFWRALHDGVRRDGADLYPVMPYPSYTLMTRADADAIHAYLGTLEPVQAPRQPNGLAFPFDIRATLGFWRELFFRPGAFQADAAKPAEWNRGAYLVTALGHCGECHTPRNRLGATEPSRALAGAVVDGWFAPDISGDLRQGVGGWPVDQLAAWLRTGADAGKGTAFGPMQEVVHDSLSRLSTADLRAIAVYLKDSPPQRSGGGAARVSGGRPDPRMATLYLENCGGCHQPLGRGIPGVVPPLAGNPAVTAERPNDVIQAVLNGLPRQGTYLAMPSFAAALDDAQVAGIANYVRTAWNNAAAGGATPALVAVLRAGDPLAAAGTEAARRLCPAITPVGAPDGMPPPLPGALSLMQGADSGDLANRTGLLLRTLRRDNPGISDARLVDSLITAYCPAVANDPQVGWDDKQDRLARFRAGLETELAAAPPAGAAVQVTTELSPGDLARATAAARAAGLTLGAWLAEAARVRAGAPEAPGAGQAPPMR